MRLRQAPGKLSEKGRRGDAEVDTAGRWRRGRRETRTEPNRTRRRTRQAEEGWEGGRTRRNIAAWGKCARRKVPARNCKLGRTRPRDLINESNSEFLIALSISRLLDRGRDARARTAGACGDYLNRESGTRFNARQPAPRGRRRRRERGGRRPPEINLPPGDAVGNSPREDRERRREMDSAESRRIPRLGDPPIESRAFEVTPRARRRIFTTGPPRIRTVAIPVRFSVPISR